MIDLVGRDESKLWPVKVRLSVGSPVIARVVLSSANLLGPELRFRQVYSASACYKTVRYSEEYARVISAWR